MSRDELRLQLERARLSAVHHRKHARELERAIATILAVARGHKCGCRTHRAVRDLAAELED